MLCRADEYFYGVIDGYGSDFFRPVSDSQLTNNLRNAYISLPDDGGREAGRIMLDLKKSGNILWASRIEPPNMSPEQLTADYAGTYYCDALGMAYKIIVVDGKLVIRHHRFGDRHIQLTDKDEFVGGIGIVRFARNEQGHVVSLGITDEDLNFKPLIFKRVQ